MSKVSKKFSNKKTLASRSDSKKNQNIENIPPTKVADFTNEEDDGLKTPKTVKDNLSRLTIISPPRAGRTAKSKKVD